MNNYHQKMFDRNEVEEEVLDRYFWSRIDTVWDQGDPKKLGEFVYAWIDGNNSDDLPYNMTLEALDPKSYRYWRGVEDFAEKCWLVKLINQLAGLSTREEFAFDDAEEAFGKLLYTLGYEVVCNTFYSHGFYYNQDRLEDGIAELYVEHDDADSFLLVYYTRREER